MEANLVKRDCYVGDEAQHMRSILNITYPIEHGIVTNWDDMETIWRYLFEKKLHVASDGDYPVLMIDTPYNPQSHREKMAQILFESFNVPAMRVIPSGILVTYACGRGRGIVLDIGDSQTTVTGLYEGFILPYAVERVDFGGRDLTNCLASFFGERGYSFTTSAQREFIREVKEKYCKVALDYEPEIEKPSTSETFELPDGKVVTIGNEGLKCPEILFQPSLIGLKHPGIHELIRNVLMKYEIDCRRDLACNIMVSGGTTMFPGIKERLAKEIKLLLPHLRFQIVCPPERKYSAWIGGSIIASLSTFEKRWVRRKDYEEYGPTIIHSDVDDIF